MKRRAFIALREIMTGAGTVGVLRNPAYSKAASQTATIHEAARLTGIHVLGPVKAWPGNAEARGKASATASLDGPLRATPPGKHGPGRRNRHEQRNCAR